jgi:hypothetical protein
MKRDGSNQKEDPELNVMFYSFRQKKEQEHNLKIINKISGVIYVLLQRKYVRLLYNMSTNSASLTEFAAL